MSNILAIILILHELAKNLMHNVIAFTEDSVMHFVTDFINFGIHRNDRNDNHDLHNSRLARRDTDHISTFQFSTLQFCLNNYSLLVYTWHNNMNIKFYHRGERARCGKGAEVSP